jgi:O-antigen ligase
MYWVGFGRLGSFSLEGFHVGLLFILVFATCTPRGISGMLRVLNASWYWLLAFFSYLLVLLPAVVGTDGFGIWVVQAYFAAAFLALAGWCAGLPAPHRALRLGASLGLLAFVLVLEYSARRVGTSVPSALMQFVSTGNYNQLIYGFFRSAFNALSASSGAGADVDSLQFRATVTNAIAAVLLVLAITYRAGAEKATDPTGSAAMLFALSMAVLLDARSVFIGGVASFVMAIVLKYQASPVRTPAILIAWVLFGAVAAGLVAAANPDSAAVNALSGGYRFEDASSESRLLQYRWALSLIEERIVVGHGWLENEQAYPIHNLFLSAWAYAGLPAFICVIVFYCGIFGLWVHHLIGTIKGGQYWRLRARPEWIAVLPILPLFRVWLSGGGGHMSAGEWIALAIFVGVMLQNQTVSKREGRAAVQMAGSQRRWDEEFLDHRAGSHG